MKLPAVKRSSFMAFMFVFFFVLSAVIMPSTVEAISAEQRRLLNSGIWYFNESEEDLCKAPSGSTGSKVFFIGDSLTVGMRDSGGLQQKAQEKGWQVTGIEATVGDTISKALPKIDTRAEQIKASDTIVIALGTNKDGAFAAKVTEMINAVKRVNASAKLYWVNAYTKAADYSDINSVLNEKSSSLGFTLIDWQKEVTSNAGLYEFSGDNIHQTAKGYGAKAAFIVGQLGQAGSISTDPAPGGNVGLQGQNNVEKAWRFLITKGLSAEQTAGIIGNLMVESGLNPFNEENGFEGQDRGGKGIAQWTATRRVDFESKAAAAGVITREAPFAAVPEAEKPIVNDKALLFNLNFLWDEATMRGDIDKLKAETVGDTPEKKIENAVISWERWYERAGKPVLGLRLQEGIKAYQQYSSLAPGSVSGSCGTGGGFGNGQQIADIALKEVGVKEGDPRCNEYFGDGLKCTTTEWCAAFARWVFREAGLEVGGGYRAKGVGKWFEDNKFFFNWTEPYKPEVGDVFVKGRGGSGRGWEGSGHVGIVVSVNNFTIETVEGNSSNQVMKRTYEDYRSIPELIGFGRYIDKSAATQVSGFNPTEGAGGVYQSNVED